MRERQLNIRLSEEEATALDAVAAHYGLNGPNVIRMLVKRAYDDVRFPRPDAPPAQKGGKKAPK